MNPRVTITRTNSGASTAVTSNGLEWSKDYGSWEQALDEALNLELLNKVEFAAAKMLPPGFPFHGGAEIDISVLTTQGFQSAKESPQ